MDREKLKELIKDSGEIASAVVMQEWVVEKIADHLIANGIGDITAEKHRADVAEEALRNGAVGEDLYCSSDYERERLYLHLIREAEARLKEL
jgi:hypothetical protein